VTNLFGQHVSPRVVERLLAIGAAELSEMRRVCVMFVDIRGFTEAARSRTPAEDVARLDAVFEILVGVVDRHNGIVNKAVNAVVAAREMLSAVGASNVGNPWPIRLCIGIHIGQAVAGTVGSPRRKEYTVIGDTVNLTSRLESLNKEVGSELMSPTLCVRRRGIRSATLCRSDPSPCAGTPSGSRSGGLRRGAGADRLFLDRIATRNCVERNFRCGRRAGVRRDRFNGRTRRIADVANGGLGRLNWADSAPTRVSSGRTGIWAKPVIP